MAPTHASSSQLPAHRRPGSSHPPPSSQQEQPQQPAASTELERAVPVTPAPQPAAEAATSSGNAVAAPVQQPSAPAHAAAHPLQETHSVPVNHAAARQLNRLRLQLQRQEGHAIDAIFDSSTAHGSTDENDVLYLKKGIRYVQSEVVWQQGAKQVRLHFLPACSFDIVARLYRSV